MTDHNDDLQEDELTVLKARATQMGLDFHHATGVEKMRTLVSEHMAATSEPKLSAQPLEGTIAETEAEMRVRKKNEANQLVRINISCMNPNKKEWGGEVFTTGNTLVGTFRKFVPFNTDYHVPQIILNMIQERECQVFFTNTDHRGNKSRQGRLIKEFSVAILDALTPAEMAALAQRQAMAAGTAAA